MNDDLDETGDRRRAARIPINAEFASMPSATYISDLSEYGVFVHTPSPSPRGTKLKLRFTVLLDDPVIVEGEGRVVRQQYEPVSGMGIEFTELAPEMILRINDVVSRQRPRDLGPPLPRDDEGPETDQAERFDPAEPDEPEPDEPDEPEPYEMDEHEAATTLTSGATEPDPLDTAQTLRRGGAAPTFAPPRSGGTFRPPSRPSADDENAKTGLFRSVNADIEDSE